MHRLEFIMLTLHIVYHNFAIQGSLAYAGVNAETKITPSLPRGLARRTIRLSSRAIFGAGGDEEPRDLDELAKIYK